MFVLWYLEPRSQDSDDILDDQKEALWQTPSASQFLPSGLHGLHPGQIQSTIPDLRAAAGWEQRCQWSSGDHAGQEADAGQSYTDTVIIIIEFYI